MGYFPLFIKLNRLLLYCRHDNIGIYSMVKNHYNVFSIGIHIATIVSIIWGSFVIPVSAQENLSIEIPGQVRGGGMYFEITDSDYLNITLESSEHINIRLESVPEIVTMMIRAVSSSTPSTTLTIRGLAPLTTYYKYEDNYHNLVEFVTDKNGSFSYAQDILISHIVFIQPYKSTKFIRDDVTGGDCTSIGIWNMTTLTCVLATNITETIQIDSNGVVLDGAGHTITGLRTGSGVYLNAKSGVVLKNFIVENFTYGVFLNGATNAQLEGILARGNTMHGIAVYESSGIIVRGVTATGTSTPAFFDGVSGSRIENSFFSTINNQALALNRSSNNIIAGDIFEATAGEALALYQGSSNNEIINNTATAKYNSIFLSGSNQNLLTDNTLLTYYADIGIGILLSHSATGNTLRDNTFRNNSTGLRFSYQSGGVNMVVNNVFENNITQIVNNGPVQIFSSPLPEGGNYWSNFDESTEGCSDANNDKICDSPYIFSGGQDNLPWITRDGWEIPTNQPPTISNLSQLKSDAFTQISEGSITTESTASFSAILSDADNDQVKLQVELKAINQPFNGTILLQGGFVASGSSATTTTTEDLILEGKYHWRARAVDNKGNMSAWQEFGTAGNMDFEVKLVPLYTQVISNFPIRSPQDEWAGLDYAEGGIGTYSCAKNVNATIARCGCAIVSAVMIARYYDVVEAQGKDVNPAEINQWLKDNNGYQKGNVNWISIAKYTDWKIKYEKTDTTISNYTLLDEKLINSQPVIAYATSTRGNIGRSHFFVINNKLTSTYNVKDPAWYNTKTLDESDSYQDKVLAQTAKIRDYENGFDGLRIYKKGDGIAQSAIIIALGSPAELLITDSQGRKIGKDNSGVEYNEIPNASYVEEGFNDPFGEDLAIQEKNKVIQILEPDNGRYELQVIGTGEGSYSLDFNFYDTQGSTTYQEFHSETAPTYIAQYNLLFNVSNSASTTIELADEMPPEAEIVFNPTSQKLEIQGVDDITVHPTFSFIENEEGAIYQIQDEAENTTKLFFKKLKQEGREIKTELEAIQYNNDPIIYTEADLKYEWSLNKDGAIKELEQTIKSGDVFDIKATYNQQKSETEVKIKQGEQEEIEQTFPGLKIIKLITKSGFLAFDY